MAIYYATKTLLKIEESIQADQGATYRKYLGQVVPHMGDAYSPHEFPFRTHLGASGIGGSCGRKVWYGFRWAQRSKHGGRLLRLFNRGHLEEARFIAMLLSIGVEVYQQDEHGNQFRISDAGGHFGGSGDGVLIHLPDLAPGTAALGEFKTSADKPFKKLKKEGCKVSKFEHYVQMNVYMRKMGLGVALYMVVNKNDDELYAELIPFDAAIADAYIDKGVNLVFTDKAPTRISNSPGWFECKWCDYRSICHLKKAPDLNCRTCAYSQPLEDGKWYCMHDSKTPTMLTKDEQLAGCTKHERKF